MSPGGREYVGGSNGLDCVTIGFMVGAVSGTGFMGEAMSGGAGCATAPMRVSANKRILRAILSPDNGRNTHTRKQEPLKGVVGRPTLYHVYVEADGR